MKIVSSPNEKGVTRLYMKGTQVMGDTPRSALTDSETPMAMTNKPAIRSIHFNNWKFWNHWAFVFG